jgi:SAM-dependent methyltransferase
VNTKFYNTIDRGRLYTTGNNRINHPFYETLTQFVGKWNLQNRKCLEIGSNKGLFQDLVHDYTGIDIVHHLSSYYHKNYIVASGANLPFNDQSFDAIFSYATHEHISDIELALGEIIRVLRPNGVCLFAPAWHSRPWFSQGYKVRPYGDLRLKQKIIKFSIPFRDFPLTRWPRVILRRILRLLLYFLSGGQPGPLMYKKLKPNYEVYWHSDSDACNSMDPFDVILWFKSRGFVCHGYEGLTKTLLVTTYALELQKIAA